MKIHKENSGERIRKIIEDLSKFSKDIEVFCKAGKSTAVFFNKGVGFQNSISEDRGIAVRLWKEDGSEYFIHSSYDDVGTLNKIIKERLKSASFFKKWISTPPNLPVKSIPPSSLNIYCKETAEASSEQLHDFLSETIKFLDEKWKGMIRVNSGELRTGFTENLLSNGRGFSGSFKRTTAYIALNFQIKTKDNKKKTKFFHNLHDFYMILGDSSLLEIDLSSILKDFEPFQSEGAKISEINAANKEEKGYKVVFSPQAASELLRFLSVLLQESHTSSRVLSNKLTIVDDPTLIRGLSSLPFDGAGFPSKKTIVMQNGKINNCLENVIRPSYRDYPQIGPTNFYIKPGMKNQKEIIKFVARGIFIISLKAFKNPNEETVSFLGQGFLIDGGKVSSFINTKILINTEIKDLFKNILEIGSDLKFFPLSGAFGSPTLLMEKVKIMPVA